ncbi:hypothetical protein JOL62DRAFT_399442 [Phyllosticta paracitricarpa]|uniref:Uncharacterized protein n=1 Tax=Phyllosticta paracitricarpa TaxID=2016321 RepID=A0ABR1MS45_9PEZI
MVRVRAPPVVPAASSPAPPLTLQQELHQFEEKLPVNAKPTADALHDFTEICRRHDVKKKALWMRLTDRCRVLIATAEAQFGQNATRLQSIQKSPWGVSLADLGDVWGYDLVFSRRLVTLLAAMACRSESSLDWKTCADAINKACAARRAGTRTKRGLPHDAMLTPDDVEEASAALGLGPLDQKRLSSKPARPPISSKVTSIPPSSVLSADSASAPPSAPALDEKIPSAEPPAAASLPAPGPVKSMHPTAPYVPFRGSKRALDSPRPASAVSSAKRLRTGLLFGGVGEDTRGRGFDRGFNRGFDGCLDEMLGAGETNRAKGLVDKTGAGEKRRRRRFDHIPDAKNPRFPIANAKAGQDVEAAATHKENIHNSIAGILFGGPRSDFTSPEVGRHFSSNSSVISDDHFRFDDEDEGDLGSLASIGKSHSGPSLLKVRNSTPTPTAATKISDAPGDLPSPCVTNTIGSTHTTTQVSGPKSSGRAKLDSLPPA